MRYWADFRNSFTKDQQEAIHQYLIDHSKIQPNGFLGIQLYVRDMDDFWRRVYARYIGEVERYNKLEKAHRQEMTGWSMMQRKATRNHNIAKSIDEGRNVWKKLVLFTYRKTRNYLFS